MEEIIFIPEVMFHPSRMRKRLFFDQVLSTLTNDPIQAADEFFSDAVSIFQVLPEVNNFESFVVCS